MYIYINIHRTRGKAIIGMAYEPQKCSIKVEKTQAKLKWLALNKIKLATSMHVTLYISIATQYFAILMYGYTCI